MPTFRVVIIGNEFFAIQCGEMLRAAGHAIAAVVTRNADVATWAQAAAIAAGVIGYRSCRGPV